MYLHIICRYLTSTRAVISIFSSPYFSVLQFSLSSPNAYQTIFPTCKHLYIVYYKIFHSELTARRFLPPSFSCALGNTVEPNISKKKPVALLVSFGCNKVSWTFTVQYCWAVYTLYMLCNNFFSRVHSTCTSIVTTYLKYMFRIFLILHVK